jgi:PPK2 family polyphosphate:nucleotide phosphotransferase
MMGDGGALASGHASIPKDGVAHGGGMPFYGSPAAPVSTTRPETITMKIDIKPYRVREGQKVRLKDWPTRGKPASKSPREMEKLLKAHVEKLSARQDLLYADGRCALLLIFQAMDAAGKDGAIKHVMSGVNPQGCQVYSFKQPSSIELGHDFLWRTNCCLPERGRIGIFNRSYYEEVLVVRVHPEILANQRLPEDTLKAKGFWKHRFRSINDLERHLHLSGTRIRKFFLHLSKGEQRKRLLARIDDPEKNWKFSRADIRERAWWSEYRAAYEDCLGSTSTKHAPWYVVPADDKDAARLIVSQVVLETLDEMRMSYPKLDKGERKELLSVRRQLAR